MNSFGALDRLVLSLVPITFILAVAGVIILRPLVKSLGETLRQMNLQRDRDRVLSEDLADLTDAVQRIEARLEAQESRQVLEASSGASGEERQFQARAE